MPETQAVKPNQAIQFLMPLSAARAASEEDGDGQWIHVLPIGKWKAPWQFMGLEIYEITADHIRQFVANFKSGIPGIDIAVDQNHRSGPAPGWIKDLRAEQDGLWARVEWTVLGDELLSQKLFRYVSPSWYDAAILPYQHPVTGEKIPWVLEGMAVTNKPFFKELPAVAHHQGNGILVCTAASPDTSRTDPDSAAGPRTTTAQGDDPMPDPSGPKQPNAANQPDPARTGDGQDTPESLRTERDAAVARSAQLEAEAAERKREDDLSKLTARFAAAKTKDGQLAQAHAERLAAVAIDVPEDKREAHVTATIEALEKGIVPKGERGGTAPHVTGGDVNPALFAAGERLGIAPEMVYMAAIRGQGGFTTREAARQAIAAMGPLMASTEIPSLSYQETMTLTRAMFLAGYETAAALVDEFANRVTGNQRTVDYRGLGAPPRMREWFDEIQGAVFNTLAEYPVTVRDWEATVEIPLTEFKADALGQYAMRIRQMGAFAKQHPDELLAAVVAAAESTLCYDGQNLCDTDHSEGDSGSQSNLLTTGNDDDNVANISTDLGAAIAAFQRFKDDRGQYLRIGSAADAVFDVICRPEVLSVFTQLATATEISGSTNQWKGRIRPSAIPELSTADEWFVLWTGGPVKPFIAQYQEEPSALKELGPDSEHCQKTGRIWLSTQGHYTVVPGDWRYIIKIQKS